ncbi:hypothetical protein NU09_0873 [Flavobacterium beibuense]|uniref:Uncharacterized protein n=1 Tax=Flavobacterium beibuense TaxID=657326 RepID=A0A444WEI5_9FLAO|nr:hypothetical protein NU09_0873 [Flavobacterium beibuense]
MPPGGQHKRAGPEFRVSACHVIREKVRECYGNIPCHYPV